MPADYSYVALFAVIGVGFVVVTLWFSWLLRPHNPSPEKLSTYECGEPPVGDAWVQLRVGYYIFALIFVLFDVEAIFVLPWAMALRRLPSAVPDWPGIAVFALVEMAVFIAILAVGLAYAWRKGALDWEQ